MRKAHTVGAAGTMAAMPQPGFSGPANCLTGDFTFTSESVSEGHPDKVCDLISDSVLDAAIAEDPGSRVACETLVKDNIVVLSGEVTTRAHLDYTRIVREAVRSVGYHHTDDPFNADAVKIIHLLSRQADEICKGVDHGGAGDQGLMFGFASDETSQLMPAPILLAHRLGQKLSEYRKELVVPWLKSDAKTQVSVRYADGRPVAVQTVVVSTHHAGTVSQEAIRELVTGRLLRDALAQWYHDDIEVFVNPSGSFVQGGPSADCGVTGRKIIVDTYGGFGRHGGGAFSGKDPSKVDRSGAYLTRYIARQVVKHGIARRAEVQVAYAIGRAQPVSVYVETFGTGDTRAAVEFVNGFDFRPQAIIERFDLLRPIYRLTTNYGHFGKPGLPWEI